MTINLPLFVFVNGPPESGKSTLCRLLAESLPSVWRESFAEPIRAMILTTFFPDQGPIDYSIDLRDANVKAAQLLPLAGIEPSVQHGIIMDLTVRAAMINWSENYMKRFFGDEIFGKLAYRRCQEQAHFYDTFLFDDSGFVPEAQFIIDQVGAARCALIRLHREGTSFAGDSRGYIQLPCQSIDLQNDGSPTDLLRQVEAVFGAHDPLTETIPSTPSSDLSHL